MLTRTWSITSFGAAGVTGVGRGRVGAGAAGTAATASASWPGRSSRRRCRWRRPGGVVAGARVDVADGVRAATGDRVDTPSPQSIVALTVSAAEAIAELDLRARRAPDDGTAVGPVTVAVGATLATVTVVSYPVRPPSRSMIAACTSSVAGPSAVSAAGSVTVRAAGLERAVVVEVVLVGEARGGVGRRGIGLGAEGHRGGLALVDRVAGQRRRRRDVVRRRSSSCTHAGRRPCRSPRRGR